ncbi:ribonuclease III [Collinsella sp. An2]|uniref:ribonuclease III n=1 Tax=Collinsella sp. An2 TaxID=1965585 RepID=UPI000B372C9C|nr:ribonuclease III [Collinsella sp. An2]OUP10129.1 ribonuclease III [Collinsella sp. An2]
MPVSEKLARVEEICDYQFNDKKLLRCAITHPSAVEGQPVSASYERLEFLGDSILGSIVALALFRSYPTFDEGKLTRLKVSLVSGMTLSDVGLELGIDSCIIFGASETGTGARGLHSALENVYESLVGAMYLDGGWDVAERFVTRTLKPHLAADRAEHPTNPKSYLQECVQGDHGDPPVYKLVDTSGPAHEPTFTAVVLVGGARMGRGTGSSKKEAEAAAALDALERLGYTTGGVILKKKLG